MRFRRLRREDSRGMTTKRSFVVSLADVFDTPADGEETETEEQTGPKWVQVTREGNFAGYAGGEQPFAFTLKTLQDMVKNIREHPSYELDENNKPIGRVIPWDFNHASERDPTTGMLPVSGAPAQAWTLDFEIRKGPNGKHQLWALTEFLEPARTYVKAGQYQWASVSVQLESVDPVTGKDVGTVVSSIALTNTPFVEGMETLVAAKNVQAQNKPGEGVQLYRRTFYEASKTPQEAINCMKEMFGLSETSGVAEVATELGVVKGWYATGQAPLGTDPDYLVGSLRTILNLPSLTPPIDVLDYALGATQALVVDQAISIGAPAQSAVATGGTVPPVSMPQAVAAARQKDPDMSELLKGLAAKLGVFQNDASVVSAVDQLVALHKGLKEIFGLSQDDPTILLGAAKKGVTATDKLTALLKALGVEDPEASVAKVQEMMASAAKLKEVMPELEGLKVKVKEKEEADVQSDVDSAIAAHKFDPALKDALLLQRRTDPKGFAEKFPKKAAEPQLAQTGAHGHLLQANLSGAPAAPGGTLMLNANGSGIQLGAGAKPAQLPAGQGVVNLSLYKGANATARAKSYLSTVTAGWDKMDNETQFLHAVELRKQPHVVDQPVS